jgi:acetyl-CoA synthetase
MWDTIQKPEKLRATAQLTPGVRAGFSWAKIEEELLDGFPDGALNIAHEAVDRHVANGFGSDTALRWLCKSGDRLDLSYADLGAASSRFASVLSGHGLAPGARVFSLLGRQPEVFYAALGTLKAGRVFSPLFSAFGPEPIEARMSIGDARVLVTTTSYYRRKPEDMALLHFTSGTTGLPKGAIHVHEAVVVHRMTGRLRAGSARRRHLLVHGRPRLGHRHVLRHHRAAGHRRDHDRRRGRDRRPSAGSHPAGSAGHCLVHRARPRSAC